MNVNDIVSENTAIKRDSLSRVARDAVCSSIFTNARRGSTKILDSGCGYGVDVRILNALGFDCVGHDKSHKFYNDSFKHILVLPNAPTFNIILSSYVLCTIPTKQQRLDYLAELKSNLLSGGTLVVGVRGFKEIENQAKKMKWRKLSDGYISSKFRKTFQKGFTIHELNLLLIQAGYRITEDIIINTREYHVISATI